MADRKQNRVRIDAITNAIRKGEYDDRLKDLRGAIDARLQTKQKEVLSLVQEIYGENYQVVPKTSMSPIFQGGGAQQVLLRSAGIPSEPAEEDALGSDPAVDGGEFESRSPIIG